MKKPSIRLVLFDLDGTLVDSLRDITQAANAALAPFGFGPFSEDRVKTCVGGGAKKLLDLLAGQRLNENESEKAVEGFLSYYQSHLTTFTKPYPGTEEVLKRLGHHSCSLVVVSNKPSRLVRGVLETLRLRHHFAALYGGDSFDRKKPDPLPLLKAIRPFNFPPEACLMIGDSPADILAGRKAGTKTCAVLYGLNDAAILENTSPDCLIKTPLELFKHFVFCDKAQPRAQEKGPSLSRSPQDSSSNAAADRSKQASAASPVQP